MLRRFYIFVLRMHPPAFRLRFGDEMLSIFDHFTTRETGLGLLLDGIVSLARQWSLRIRSSIEIPAHSSRAATDGVPSFYTLERFHPKAPALIHGLLLSSLLFGLTCFAIKYSWIHLLHVRIPEVEFPSQPEQTTSSAAIALRTPDLPREPEFPAKTSVAAGNNPHPPSAAPSQGQAKPQPGMSVVPATNAHAIRPAVQNRTLSSAEQHSVIQAMARNLTESYFDRDVAQKTADAFYAHEKNGDYTQITDSATFADVLTTQMRQLSHDQHLVMEYSSTSLPLPVPSTMASPRYRNLMEQNCKFEKVEVLPRNIGYLKLNSFPDPAICESVAKSAMTSLNGADAIIFDLRDNGGGDPAMVALIAAYLFDHPEYWYNPREATTEHSWTQSPIPGNHLASKPVYVLTSPRTLSGAEQFTYDLKMLKRATIVGERTGGAAHAGVWHRINDHFGIGVPETKAINPFSRSDWEGVGVEPDVKVDAADALRTAQKLAQTGTRQK